MRFLHGNFTIQERKGLQFPVVHNEHIQLLPFLKFLFGDQKLLLKVLRVFLGRQGHKALKGAGHQVRAGYTAQQPHGGIPDLQWVEYIKQVLLQGIALVYKGEPDEHITVNHLSGVIDLTAPSGRGYSADGQGGLIVARGIFPFIYINDPILQTFVPAVIKIKIQPLRLKKGLLAGI